MAFRVTNIIDGETIQVAGWKWQDVSGTRVKITGYTINPNDPQFGNLAKSRLTTLLSGKDVDLRNPIKIDSSDNLGPTINCSVFLNDIDVANYFPELRQKQQT